MPTTHPNITKLTEAGISVGRLTAKRTEAISSLSRAEVDTIIKINKRLVTKGLAADGDTNGYVVF